MNLLLLIELGINEPRPVWKIYTLIGQAEICHIARSCGKGKEGQRRKSP